MSVGTPQCSPISPLLFVIYVSRLHVEIPYGLTLSYVDDFALLGSTTSYHRDVRLVHKHYALINGRGSQLGVGFSISKTELIHW